MPPSSPWSTSPRLHLRSLAGRGSRSSLDNTAFTWYASPKSYSYLPDGSHAFEVRATDTAGNSDATLAGRTWTVDTTATKVLTSVTGTKISENAPRTKYGATSSLGAGGDEPDNSGNDIYALIRWDLSTILTGSKVCSASVTLNVTNVSIEA
jgi:hypothetical protein